MVSTDSLQLHFKNKSYFKIATFYFNFLVGKNKKTNERKSSVRKKWWA
jgi:hypothetical protein